MLAAPDGPATSTARPRRVLHLAAGAIWGGVESMLLTLARERASAPMVEPCFVLGHAGEVEAALRAAGVRVATLPTARLSRPMSVLAARRALAAIVRDWAPDVVVSHGAWMLAVHGGVVRGAGIPLVLYAHDAVERPTLVDRLARRHGGAMRVVANSAFTASRARAAYRPSAIAVAAPPVAEPAPMTAAERSRLRQELATPDTAFVVVQLGRLDPWKGHETLLRALAVAELPADLVVWIVGGAQRPAEREHEARMRALAATLGLDARVRWAGLRDDARRLAAAADVVVQPNLLPEPFGLVLVEAMWAGRAIVASAIGAAPSVLEGQGVLVPPGASEPLAEALRQLHGDAALRDRLADSGPVRARLLADPGHAIPALYDAVGVGRDALARA